MVYFFDSKEETTDQRSEANPIGAASSPLDHYSSYKLRLHEEVLRSQRHDHPFALIYVAINRPGGDSPEEWERLLRSNIREYDIICPVKPEEFLITLPEIGERHAEKVAQRLGAVVTRKNAEVRTDIAMACFPQDGRNAEDLLLSIEQDLKQARRRSR